MLSIFCPYRSRPKLYKDFIMHYKTHYPAAKIYMLEQDDVKKFKRGQLMNAGFKYLMQMGIFLDDILFVDVDIRLEYTIDFQGILEQHKTVVIPFNHLSLYDFVAIGKYKKIDKPTYFLSNPDGGVTLFKRDMFLKCNGFSNLYIGWGREDSDFVRRNTITRVPNKMIHLEHERGGEWKSPTFQTNMKLFDEKFNYILDGFRQTTAKVYMQKIEIDVYNLKIQDIDVTSDYAYKSKIKGRINVG